MFYPNTLDLKKGIKGIRLKDMVKKKHTKIKPINGVFLKEGNWVAIFTEADV